jgi:hypothetical protein
VHEEIAARFALGRLVAAPEPVTGGLSNDLWRVRTESGEYGVKRMVTNATRPDFTANVESAFLIEQRAWIAGVPMPEPVPDPATGRALARIEGAPVRVHRWVEGTPVESAAARGAPGGGTPGRGAAAGGLPVGSAAADGAALLAVIHAAGRSWRGAPPEPVWDGRRWGPEVGELGRRVAQAPRQVLVVDSHRDLDPKNTLRRSDGVLVALDWDAAGPVSAVREAVAVALDFGGTGAAAFGAALHAYRGGVPAEPWVFGGWVAAQGGWLDHQAATGGSDREPTLGRLRDLAASLDDLLGALG